jgi:APA family basic amino acid/polyamine antiporter
MLGLPRTAWERFGAWLVIGLALYFSYGFKHSRLRKAA